MLVVNTALLCPSPKSNNPGALNYIILILTTTRGVIDYANEALFTTFY